MMRPGVAVTPYGGVVVRTPYFNYSRAPSPFYPRPLGGVYRSPSYLGYRIEAGAMGSGVSVTVGRPLSKPAVELNEPTPATAAWSTPAVNEAPAFVPPSLAPVEQAPSANESAADLVSQLLSANQALQSKLDDFNGGAGWQKYLALPEVAVTDRERLTKLLTRMDSVAREGEYQVIAELEEFQRLHQLLELSVVSGAKASMPRKPDAPRVPSEPAEALPTPSPEPQTPEPQADGGERSILSPAQ